MANKPVKFTDRFLDTYKPVTARDEIFDKGGNGLGVRVTPKAKTFFFVRRVKGGKTRFTLGRYPDLSLAKARAEANILLDRINKGNDPRIDLVTRKQAASEAAENTFANIAKRFIAEYAEGKKTPLSKRTIEGYRWALQGHLTEKWASRSLIEITDRDVIRIIDKLEAVKRFASARLFRAYLSKFSNWCIGKRLIRENPTRGVSLGSEPADFKRDRHLSMTELQAVLDAANGQGEPWRGYIWALILTGQRRSETALMKWSDLTLEGEKPIWRIPAANTKNRRAHEVPLSIEAVAVLSRIPRLGEHVFTTNGKTPISGFSKIKTAIDKATAENKIEPWRIHDLRRSVSTELGELGFAPHVIELVMNHISGEKAGVSGLYNRSRYEADCRRALAAWAQVVTEKDAGANVVQLAARAS